MQYASMLRFVCENNGFFGDGQKQYALTGDMPLVANCLLYKCCTLYFSGFIIFRSGFIVYVQMCGILIGAMSVHSMTTIQADPTLPETSKGARR